MTTRPQALRESPASLSLSPAVPPIYDSLALPRLAPVSGRERRAAAWQGVQSSIESTPSCDTYVKPGSDIIYDDRSAARSLRVCIALQ